MRHRLTNIGHDMKEFNSYLSSALISTLLKTAAFYEEIVLVIGSQSKKRTFRKYSIPPAQVVPFDIKMISQKFQLDRSILNGASKPFIVECEKVRIRSVTHSHAPSRAAPPRTG